MLKKGKKRFSVTVDADVLDYVTDTLKEREYPFGSLSHYLNDCLVDLAEYLDSGSTHNVDVYLQLEASRVGIKEALEQRGLKVTKWTDDELKPWRR